MITRVEAIRWFNEYLQAIDETVETGVVEFVWGLPESEYERHVDFVWQCLQFGMKPTHFVNTIAEMWGRQLELIIKFRSEGK